MCKLFVPLRYNITQKLLLSLEVKLFVLVSYFKFTVTCKPKNFVSYLYLMSVLANQILGLKKLYSAKYQKTLL